VSFLRRQVVAILWVAVLGKPAFADPATSSQHRSPSLLEPAAQPLAAAPDRARGPFGELPDDPASEPPGQAKFRVFAAAEGLQNLVILAIAQDDNGFLWLGTEDGVYRFDGERFTHFSVEDGLSSSLISVIGVAPDGTVFVGTYKGLTAWDGQRFSQSRAAGVPAVSIHAIVSFAGKLWIGTEAGLFVQGANGVFVPAPGWPGPPTAIRALWADAGGLVVGDGATVELSAGDGAWRGIGDVGLVGDRVEGVLRDRRGALWIRTQAHMWSLLPGATRATDLRAGLPTGYDVLGGATSMTIGPRGDVLVATDIGIAYRDHDRWQIVDRSVGMQAAATRVLFVDREGTIWLGAAGLFQLRGRGVIEHYDLMSGLPGDVVWSYQRDRQGRLWIGTNRCLAHAVAGHWRCLPGSEGRAVRSIVFPPQGGVFIGGAPSNLLYIAPDGRTTALGEFEHPAEHNILALALGPDGDLWIGTKVGLFRLPGAIPGRLERVAVPGVAADDRFASLVVVGGQLWSATAAGVVVFDHGVWHVFAEASGFRSPGMSYVLARADGRMCVAYQEALGLSCFRYDGRTVSDLQHIGTTSGLATGMVYFLGEDRAHRLWVGTGDGVDVVTPLGIDHFDESDGLAGNDSAATAFLADGDGSLWLGSTGGATHVFAQYYGGPPRAPYTTFLDGRIGDHAIRGGSHGEAADAAIESPHDHNALMIEFAASTILDARRVEYQVRMAPLESEWSQIRQRQARYPALPPGSYRFEVRARIAAGAWGPVSGLGFTILPAWWQTRWFFAAIGLLGLGTVGAGFTRRQRIVLRRRTRELHARSDASFRAVIDQMPDMISVHRDRKRIYVNRAFRRLLGLAAADDRWQDIDLADRIHPDDRAQLEALFAGVVLLEPGTTSELVEIRVRSADAGWRTCEVSAIRVEIGGALTVIASGRDVTERKRLRAKLLVSDRMASLGTLAAGIAHEINNPLAYVTGNLEAMAEALQAAKRSATAADGEVLAAVVNDARDGAERVRRIVHGLRSFSRSEQAEQRAPLALAGVLDAAIRLTGNEVRHRAQLVCELGAVPLVVADDGRLTQVFINLLINAAHAIPEGRSDANRITVRTRTDDHGRAVVEVEDTGRGIAAELQSRVFDPFFTTKDIGEGTGLGLSICHGIISGLGGQISIESAPERGTLVRVVLPPQLGAAAPAPPAVPDAAPAADPTEQRRYRVMLVDDEPLIAQTMERLLRRDYDVTVALCGREAIGHIAQGVRFDAIVSDVMMPNMTGIELIEELQRVAPDQAERLIFLSGGAFTAQARERLDALGAPQLEKPVTAKDLRACVRRVASEARPLAS
jgi:PAS domain S-box-containing protein